MDVAAEDIAVEFDSVSFAYDRNLKLPSKEETADYDADRTLSAPGAVDWRTGDGAGWPRRLPKGEAKMA